MHSQHFSNSLEDDCLLQREALTLANAGCYVGVIGSLDGADGHDVKTLAMASHLVAGVSVRVDVQEHRCLRQ